MLSDTRGAPAKSKIPPRLNIQPSHGLRTRDGTIALTSLSRGSGMGISSYFISEESPGL